MTGDDFTPVIHLIRRSNGVAGQYEYAATVEYPGEGRSTVRFVSSTFGAPIVMVTEGNPRGTFVTKPERFGSKLDTDWVRAFFTA